MPNHVTNTIRLQSDTEGAVAALLEFIKGECEVIDFETLIPETDEVKTSLAHNGEERGCPFWYDWRVENWGTKWNAYDQSMEDEGYGEFELRFDTAWAAPLPIIAALRERFPDVHIYGSWLEEGHQSAGVF